MSQPPERQRLTVADVRAELDALERSYGVPSQRRFEAFPGDDRCGEEELVRWSELYHIWRTSQRPAPTR